MKPVAQTAFLYTYIQSSLRGEGWGHRFDWPRKMHPPPNQQTTAPIPTHQRRCARGAAVPARFCDRSEALVPASHLIRHWSVADWGNTAPQSLVSLRDRPADPAWSSFPLRRDRNTTAVPETRWTRHESSRHFRLYDRGIYICEKVC